MHVTPMRSITGTGPAWERALVTGGAGFLGSHLCERLLELGTAVTCVDNLSTGSADNIAHLVDLSGFRFLEHDVNGFTAPGSPDTLAGPYDLVLHFAVPAAPADRRRRPLETLDAGSVGTHSALAVACRDGARFLLGSSSAVYGRPRTHPQREDDVGEVDPVGRRCAYEEAQRFSEALVTAYAGTEGADAGIVRVFSTYGPRMRADDGRVVSTFIRQALAGEALTVAGDGRQTRSLCFVDDGVEAVLVVAASRSVRPVNVGGGEETSVAELARRVIALSGSDSALRFVDRPAGEAERRVPDTTWVRELFGWNPRVSWEEGLQRTIAHFARLPGDGGPRRLAPVTHARGERVP
jgi:dTDP-glucose 4,6-dehydratase